MAFVIKNKVVLVTGASSGIGREVAKEFAHRGARVAITARDIEKLNGIKKEIMQNGGVAEVFQFDLGDTDKIPDLINRVCNHFGDSVSILVNSAGFAVLGLVEDVPIEAYNDNLKVNFFAPLALIKAVVPGMKSKKCGQIINISSGVGKRGLPGVSPYCVSKFALNAITESIRVELSPYGIDVILVSPGLVRTGFNDSTKIYGNLKETFANGKKSPVKKIAGKIVDASANRKREVTLSLRTRIAYHLNYWSPSLVDFILKHKLKSKGQFDDVKGNNKI